ncbi:MAG: CDP-glucose 4,6-dehydratase [Romboutsia sp.]|nr:CDP-glucose 4,6-dehydratase [Romboutsia sp.]
MANSFWKDKTVLITGDSGFKGSWLSIYLLTLGAKIIGISLPPKRDIDNFNLCDLDKKITHITGDIRDKHLINNLFKKYEPDIVFHLAAQPLVIDSYKNPHETYETNVMGTLNILDGMKIINKKMVGIFVTTDKCYENKENNYAFREDDPLGGYDIYSSSKACCEILISSYRNSFFNKSSYNEHKKDISSVRAGNVIGGGDFSDYRLIPDCIKAFENNESVIIRNPKSIRPWQHVLEPLSGYILLAEKMYENPIQYGGTYNFGPYLKDVLTVGELTKKIAKRFNMEDKIKIQRNNVYHEADLLFLDITKSSFYLGFKPVLDINKALDFTVEYYQNYKKENVFNLCRNQINEYIKLR